MAASHPNRRSKSLPIGSHLRLLLLLVALAIALYVFVPRIPSFHNSWAVLGTASPVECGLALLAIAGTNIAGALVYWRLVSRPIPFWPMVVIQVASSFTNRLLPAGTGAMATGAAYLMRRGHTAAQAGSVAVLNNVLGFIGNVLLLGLVLICSPSPLGARMPHAIPSWVWVAIIGVLATILLTALWWPRARRILYEGLREMRRVFQRPGRVLGALAASMALTSCFGLALFLSALAVGVHLTVLQAMYILTAGVAAGAVTPSPGGLGGVEAGLVAAMVSLGIPASSALAAALLYRLVSYWAPIVPGFICFQIALKKHYV